LGFPTRVRTSNGETQRVFKRPVPPQLRDRCDKNKARPRRSFITSFTLARQTCVAKKETVRCKKHRLDQRLKQNSDRHAGQKLDKE
jgi:hypothetical protein